MPRVASRMKLVKTSPIRELLALAADPAIISFGGGYPDPEAFPTADLAASYQRAVADHGRTALQYAASEGIPRLREQIAERMRAEGVACGPEHVLITQGAQQAIDLAARLWLDPGDLVIVEHPTYIGGPFALNIAEPSYASVGLDEQGIDVKYLEDVLRANPKAKLLYTIPDFHNPTGRSISQDRRARLVELAREHDLIVLEDTPYRELYYTADKLPSLKSFDTDDRVYYIGSFSKTLAPGLRTGWIVADPQTIERLTLLKLASDTQNSTVNMTALSLYLDGCDYDAHLDRMREHYRRKRDLVLEVLEQELPPEVAFTRPDGGLFVWLTFPEHIDTERLLREHLIPDHRVAFVPGSAFYAQNPLPNNGRMGFSTLSDERIVEGVRRLAHGYRQSQLLR